MSHPYRIIDVLEAQSAACVQRARDSRIMTMAQQLGYTDVTWREGAGVCGLRRFIYTVGVCYGLDETGCAGRFCFDTEQNARLFLMDWDGSTPAEVGIDGCKAIK